MAVSQNLNIRSKNPLGEEEVSDQSTSESIERRSRYKITIAQDRNITGETIMADESAKHLDNNSIRELRRYRF